MARKNIRTGPMIQFWTSDKPKIRVFLKTSPSSSYFTFAKGGYIMIISPMAMGIWVVPTDNESQKLAIEGNSHPDNTPESIAIKIQSVR